MVYEIDMLRCIFCGYCVDACPEEAIIMSNNYDMAYFNRDAVDRRQGRPDEAVHLRRGPARLPPRYPEEDGQRASMRNQAFDLVAAAKQGAATGKRTTVH